MRNPNLKPISILGISISLLMSSPLALSQSISSGQLEKRFDKPLEPLSQPKASIEYEVKGSKAPDNADQIKLKLNRVDIDGVSVFAENEIESIYSDSLGKEITLAEVYQFAEKITAYYGNQGYLLSRAIVPPQQINNGIVKIKVIEGYIDEVIVEGVDGVRPEIFNHVIAQIKASKPLHADVLERYLLLANDLSGLKFKSVLNPSKTNIGAATLVMTATKKSIEGAVSWDNRGSESSGPHQLLLEATVNDVYKYLFSTTIRYATVPNNAEELKYIQLHHEHILNGEGLKLAFDFSKTDSEPDGLTFRSFDVETAGNSGGVSLSYPVIRSREENFFVSGSFTARTSDTLQFGVINTRDKLRVFRFSGNYDKSDTYLGGGISLLSATLSLGADMAGAQVESRAASEPAFEHLQFQARRIQQINEKWTMDLRTQGQWANKTLPSAEQFGLGGEQTVRGYEPSEWTGDSAFTASAELRYEVPDIDWEGTMQLYGFYDWGKIWRENKANLPLIEKTIIKDSAGFGTRLTFPNDIAVNFEIARPFDEYANGDDNEFELYGRVSVQF